MNHTHLFDTGQPVDMEVTGAESSIDDVYNTEEALSDASDPSSSGHTQALSAGSVMFVGAMVAMNGSPSTSGDVRPTVRESSPKLSRAAQLFRKFTSLPKSAVPR